LLNTVGGVLVGLLSALDITIVDVEANAIEVLAADPNVSYIHSTRRYAVPVT
jgi:hypothetical protein